MYEIIVHFFPGRRRHSSRIQITTERQDFRHFSQPSIVVIFFLTPHTHPPDDVDDNTQVILCRSLRAAVYMRTLCVRSPGLFITRPPPPRTRQHSNHRTQFRDLCVRKKERDELKMNRKSENLLIQNSIKLPTRRGESERARVKRTRWP